MSGELNSQHFELYVIDDMTVPLTPAALKIANITSIGEIGQVAGEIDITNLDSMAKEFMKGLGDNGEMALEMNLNPDAASHKLLRKLAGLTSGATKKFALVGSGGVAPPVATAGSWVMTTVNDRAWWTFNAFVKSFRNQSIGIDSVVKCSAALRLSGAVISSMDT